MSSETLGDAIRICSASAQTDSLSVVWDLTKVEPAAEQAIDELLGMHQADGGQMVPIKFASFADACGARYNALLQTNPAAALQLATMIGIFFHECRHIHDLRLTRAGAELLLLELDAYNDGPYILEALRNWQCENPNDRIFYPLKVGDLEQMGLAPDVVTAWQRSTEQRAAMEGAWTRTSCFKILPGLSIRNLFETLGFVVQIEVTAHAFGEKAYELIIEAMTSVAQYDYMNPAIRLKTLCDLRSMPEPEPLDLSILITDALTVCSITEAFFDDGRPTDRHPGAWFDRFCEVFANTPNDLHPDPRARAFDTSDTVLGRENLGTMEERIATANDVIDAELRRMGKDLVRDFRLPPGAAVQVLTEVAIDFREMQNAVKVHRDYHKPLGYAQLLLAGELTGVYLTVQTRKGVIDLRTPSHIPANHIGACRVATCAAKEMRKLAHGPSLGSDFLDEELLQHMLAEPPEGLGLNLRVR